MKTSPSQFIIMVDCMEWNGDLNKPAEGPHGRFEQNKKWADIAKVLNLDLTGEAKPVEKWKKVWSDLKNNTKRKAAKIHRSASGTGGGPPSKLVLSDLELRILTISGSKAATGLTNIDEVGAPPARPVPESIRSPTPPTELTSPVPDIVICVETSPPPAHSSPPSTQTFPPSRRRDLRPRSASRRSAPRTPRVDSH